MFDLQKKIGVKSFSFREIKENSACAWAVRHCGSTCVDLSGTHVNYDAPESWAQVIADYREAGVIICGIGAVKMIPDEAWNRRFFDFARQAGAGLISMSFEMEEFEKTLAIVEKLCGEYGIPGAIHNHGGYNWLGNATALEYVFKRTSKQIGLCLDTAWCIHTERENPVGWIEKFRGRIFGFHFKDFCWNREGKHLDTVVGEGALKLKETLEAFKSLELIRSAVLEYEGADAVESTRRSIANVRAIY